VTVTSLILSILKPVFISIQIVFKSYPYIKNYFELKKAQPMAFTVISKTKLGTLLYTSGRVVSINLWKVVIEGYQLNDPQSTNGEFTIKLHSISGVGPRDPSL